MKPLIDLVETPFLYESMLEEVLNAGPIWPRILIWGGPGLGKSRFAQELELEARNVSRLSVTLLSGKEEDAEKELLRWAKNPTGLMIVDDFDRCWSKHLESAIKSLPEDNPEFWRIVVTVSNPEELDEEVDIAGSHALTTFHRLRLDPWSDLSGVELALEESLHTTVRQQIRSKGLPQTDRIAFSQIIEDWCAATLTVSEGHPLLVGGSFIEFLRLANEFIQLKPSTLDSITLKRVPRQDEMENHLTAALMDAPPTRRLFETIRRCRKKQPQAFKHLVSLAKGNQLSVIEFPTIYQALRDSGLAYISRSGRLAVASGIARAKILELAQRDSGLTEPRPSVHHSTLPLELKLESTGEGRGFLRYVAADGQTGHCRLRGKSYRILEILSEEPGKIFSLAELMNRLDATEHAVRGAIQRLTRNLDKASLTDVVLNHHGKGYVLGSSPYIRNA